jgi:hypothetical protein
MTRTFTLAASLACIIAGAVVAAEPDYTSPKAAFQTYTAALAAGDAAAAKASVVSNDKIDKLLDGQIAYAAREKKFRDAIIKRFPDEAKNLPDPSVENLKAIEKADVKVDGDTATLTTTQTPGPVKLQRVDGKWKVDLVSMYPPDNIEQVVRFRTALGEIIEDMTPEIEAGKFKTYDDVKTNLESRMKMRIALPQDEATTRPND